MLFIAFFSPRTCTSSILPAAFCFESVQQSAVSGQRSMLPNVDAIRECRRTHASWCNILTRCVFASQSKPRVHFRAYLLQARGHEISDLDPLSIMERPTPDVLDLGFYGLSDADLSQSYVVGDAGKALFPEDPTGVHPLSEIVERMQKAYCQRIGYEYMYIQEKDRCEWLRKRIEGPQEGYTVEKKLEVARGLAAGHGFEAVLEKKFGTEKRFGVDGCESLIPGMNQMIEQASSAGVKTCIIGMPHRGRLNVLCNVMQKPIEMIFNEFAGLSSDDDGSGDVKYHLGISSDVDCKSGTPMHLSLLANPSHLEAVDPVVEGKARAEQLLLNDPDGKQVMPVLLHGDAAFAGQGVVFETFGMVSKVLHFVRHVCTCTQFARAFLPPKLLDLLWPVFA